jgi:hypothetical protein
MSFNSVSSLVKTESLGIDISITSLSFSHGVASKLSPRYSNHLTDIPQIFIYLYVYVYLYFQIDFIRKNFILELNINKFYQ